MSSYVTTPDHATAVTGARSVYAPIATTKVDVKVPYFPPRFTKFGENIRNLLKQKYDFTHSLKTTTTTATGVTVETGVDAKRAGYILAKEKIGAYDVEAKISTAETAETKLTITHPRLYEGLLGSITAYGRPKEVTKGDLAGAKLEYVRPNFTATTEFNTNGNEHRAIATTSVGFDNISIGGQINVNAGSTVEVNDYNLGVEYKYAGSVASLWTESQADIAVFNYYHLVHPNNAVGAQFRVEIGGTHQSQLTLANEYKLDAATSIKGKLDFPAGVLSAAFERKLVNPNVKFNVAASFTPCSFVSKPVAADKFGVGLTFGDY